MKKTVASIIQALRKLGDAFAAPADARTTGRQKLGKPGRRRGSPPVSTRRQALRRAAREI